MTSTSISVMTTLNILSELNESTGLTEREALLKSIPASSDFWISAHHGLQPLIPYPVQYSLRNPITYGNGVPDGVFPKILNGMIDGTLNEIATVDAITAFSSYCTEDEWLNWFRPILDKRLRIPLTIKEFNKHCPRKLKVTNNPTLSTMVPAAKAKGFPTEFVLEPYTEAQRLLVLFRGNTTHVFLEDGTPVHRMLPKAVERFVGTEDTVLELYEMDGPTYVARDVLLWDQFIGETPCPPVNVRLQVLTDILQGANIEVAEHYYHNGTTNPRDEITVMFQSGHDGVIMRTGKCDYNDDLANILILPKRKSILTCTRIHDGEGDHKYADKVEFVWGKGRMNNKSFESPVFHGLTFSDREMISNGREDFVGKRFEVLSCGLDANEKLIFPVFKRWKTKA
jgi:hypothetical protein